jgi:protein-disulfide isomerase
VRARFDIIVMVTLVVCALLTTGLVVRREFFLPDHGSVRTVPNPLFVRDWKEGLSKGVRFGAADAPVQLIEFADFECPFCAEFEKALQPLHEKYPGGIGLTYVHFPIRGHRFAIPAARVAECAGEQGRFEAMHDQLFEGQDQFGLKPWDDYATAAGVADLPAFDACIKKSDPIPRVEEGKALGAKLDVQGTPTVIINGWKLGHPPSAEELEGMVKAILAGRSPVTSDGKFAK